MTNNDIFAIKNSPESTRTLADKYGVSASTISNIKNGRGKFANIAYEVTAENYYDLECDRIYVSNSQYKNFCGTPGYYGCEERALAELAGDYVRKESDAMLVGSYVHAYFEGTILDFVSKHPEIYSSKGATKGELRQPYKVAVTMIQRCLKDEGFMAYLEGEHEVIMTGEISGVPVKVKLDSFDGFRITDLKTVDRPEFPKYPKDLGQKLPFFEQFGYDTQLAIYREIVRQNTGDTLPCYIAFVSKSEHPNHNVIKLSPQNMDAKLEEVKRNIIRIQDLKEGIYEPIRCERCDYCYDTREVTEPIEEDEFWDSI